MLSYNKAQYLVAAIQSVLSQSFRDWELIVADDSSTDHSWEVCETYARLDSRIKAARNQERLGIPRNRARAFAMATGDLVCHLDCDDLLYPWSLEAMERAFSSFPDLVYAYSDFALINAASRVVQYRVNPDFSADLSVFGWRHLGMYRKAYADELGGYNDQISRPCEDGDLVMRMAAAGWPIARIPLVLYQHRHLPGNASAQAGKCAECGDQHKCNYFQIWQKYALRSGRTTLRFLEDVTF